MFEQTTRVLSENLARAVDRRTFLKRAGQATFGVVATIAAGHSLAGRAAATAGPGPSVDPMQPQCAPPGPYCNTGGGQLSGCHGAHCFQHLSGGQVLQCQVMYGWYQAGCWTTAVSPPGSGYWTCCDCACGPNGGSPLCGCAQFSTGPVPLPDGPASTKG
jgi:hypothetical protein